MCSLCSQLLHWAGQRWIVKQVAQSVPRAVQTFVLLSYSTLVTRSLQCHHRLCLLTGLTQCGFEIPTSRSSTAPLAEQCFSVLGIKVFCNKDILNLMSEQSTTYYTHACFCTASIRQQIMQNTLHFSCNRSLATCTHQGLVAYWLWAWCHVTADTRSLLRTDCTLSEMDWKQCYYWRDWHNVSLSHVLKKGK